MHVSRSLLCGAGVITSACLAFSGTASAQTATPPTVTPAAQVGLPVRPPGILARTNSACLDGQEAIETQVSGLPAGQQNQVWVEVRPGQVVFSQVMALAAADSVHRDITDGYAFPAFYGPNSGPELLTDQLVSGPIVVGWYTVAVLDLNLPVGQQLLHTERIYVRSCAQGYRLVASDGGVFSFGSAGFYGSTGNIRLNQPIVGMATTPDGQGYWLVAADGGVFAYGDATFYGSAQGPLPAPIVGMAAAPDGLGYWLVDADGGVYPFGQVPVLGSLSPGLRSSRIVGIASSPSDYGYWVVGADGQVYPFGDAEYYGSTVDVPLNAPIVGMATTPDGQGYWLVAADGGVFAYGDATFYGSTGNLRLNRPIVGITPTPSGNGYWLEASDGGVFAFGDASFLGSMGGTLLNQPVVSGS